MLHVIEKNIRWELICAHCFVHQCAPVFCAPCAPVCTVCKSELKVLRGAPYKQPPSRPLSTLHDDNNAGNYADVMDTMSEEKERNHLKLGFVWFSTQNIFLTRTNNEIHCNQKHIGVSRTKDT